MYNKDSDQVLFLVMKAALEAETYEEAVGYLKAGKIFTKAYFILSDVNK